MYVMKEKVANINVKPFFSACIIKCFQRCSWIMSSSLLLPHVPAADREGNRRFWGQLKREADLFSSPHSDCFPSVLPHWPQCRCCRKPSRWECHKWSDTNVGLSHSSDLQHTLRTFWFPFYVPHLRPNLCLFPSLGFNIIQCLKKVCIKNGPCSFLAYLSLC